MLSTKYDDNYFNHCFNQMTTSINALSLSVLLDYSKLNSLSFFSKQTKEYILITNSNEIYMKIFT